MKVTHRIVPCLWFDDEAENAATFYISIFPNSRIDKISRRGSSGMELHGKPAGSVLTVAFELDGQPFTALNGGPAFRFNEAVSLQVLCETQDDIDEYWHKLAAEGDESAQRCGWLKDRYGLSWQVIPVALVEMIGDPTSDASQRAMAAMLQMKKIDLAGLKRAFAGEESDPTSRPPRRV